MNAVSSVFEIEEMEASTVSYEPELTLCEKSTDASKGFCMNEQVDLKSVTVSGKITVSF